VSTLVISYGDINYIGGVASVLGTIETGNILTSVLQKLGDYWPIRCKAGQSWTWDLVKFSILSPKPANLFSDNDNSCVLQIQAQHGTALFTGDIEEAAESWLVETYQDELKADVQISPHHGSQTSSKSAFLTAVQPNTVLIPAGYRNQFGYPHQDILQRYRDLHIR
jgi:competence protein ComEC